MKFHGIILIATLFGAAPQNSFSEEKPAKQKPANRIENINIDRAEKLLQTNTNIVILDVRTRKEFAAGHLANAKNLDLYATDFEEQLLKMDKSKPYLVHCATGGRSAEARDKMKEIGFQNIYHMEGGYKAWDKAGKKVEK